VSNIVIINHSLLFVDLKNDFNYFGNIDNLIIDEAHSIEDIATECMKKSFSYKIIEDILKYSENTFKNNFIDQSLLSSKKEDLIFTSKTFFEIFESYLLDKKNNDNYLINKLLDDDFYNKQDETFILI
jgi:Rad3-related DNA helicase